jgi:transglutaminase-like putative cysteine protease
MKLAVRRPTAPADQAVAIATVAVAVGVVLTMLPLRSIFTDWIWLTTSITCALPYWLTVGLLRTRSAPHWWHSVLGLGASILMLLWVFVPQHLGYGVLPNPTALRDIGDLVNASRDQMKGEHAPLASNHALRLLTCSAMVLLTALTDVLGVLLRRPLLAAAPLLEVLAVASATSSSAAHPVWFAAAAVGFLLILLSGTRLQDRMWGPSVDGSAGRLGGARRMAVTGIVAALLVPMALPSVSVNLLARAAHHDGGGNSSSGSGSGQIELRNLASLRGSLNRNTPTELMQVQVDPGSQPKYVRQSVLEVFTNNQGWVAAGNQLPTGGLINVGEQSFPMEPGASGGDSFEGQQINARFTIAGLGGRQLPIFAAPHTITDVSGSWNAATGTVEDVALRRGDRYSVNFVQPTPSLEQLGSAPRWQGSGNSTNDDRYLKLPAMPTEVTDLARQLTAGLGPYEQARAISDYFTNGKNGFKYSLNAPTDDGRQPLVTFLDKKTGFCQQYAAAAAVLMRVAGLPARVVLGYTHQTPDSSGNFTITTADAHAWVEVYFQSIGWVTFDPTPFSGADLARAGTFSWAPHPETGAGTSSEPSAPSASRTNDPNSRLDLNRDSATQPTNQSLAHHWLTAPVMAVTTVIVLLLLLVGPRLVRRRQRRRRLAIARATGNPELLWLELAASATDRDLLWPATTTVGQVPEWLAQRGVDDQGTAALTAVAERVEADRFSPRQVQELPKEFVASFDGALTRWARRAERRQRLLHRWVPRSLVVRRSGWRR